LLLFFGSVVSFGAGIYCICRHLFIGALASSVAAGGLWTLIGFAAGD
jgi:hypothetical protein